MTQAALEAETHEAVQVSRRLNDNLIEAIRGIWRQLLFIWVMVIILAVFYLVVLGYMPLTSKVAQEKNQVLPDTGVLMTTAGPAQASPNPLP